MFLHLSRGVYRGVALKLRANDDRVLGGHVLLMAGSRRTVGSPCRHAVAHLIISAYRKIL